MTDPTTEEYAASIWSMARDLATPDLAGTPLNSDRGRRQVHRAIESAANHIAAAKILDLCSRETANLKVKVSELKAKLKEFS